MSDWRLIKAKLRNRLTSPEALGAAGIWPRGPGGATRPARSAPLAPPPAAHSLAASPWEPSCCLMDNGVHPK